MIPTFPALAPGRPWEAMRAGFRWDLPARFNIAHAINGRWAAAEPDRLALVHVREDGAAERWTHGMLDRAARRLANVLAAGGVGRGDRVAVLLPQSPQALVAHLAAYRLGAVVVPLFTLFGADGIAFRLRDSGAVAVVTDAANRDKLAEAAPPLVLSVGGRGAEDFDAALARASEAHEAVETGPEDPAFISYTSGTTGPPKGALHAHRVLIGHLPGASIVHDFMPHPGAEPPDAMWTPADWAWMGGLCNVLMPALFWGVPVVARRFPKFDPERAFALMADHRVTAIFAPPTALRLMREVADPRRFGLALRTLGCGGEALGAELLDWGREALGLTIHEFYGQTECNKAVCNNATLFPVRPGSMGRATPGFDLAILDSQGRVLPPGETGEIAMRRGSAAMFLGYWGRPDKTAEKFAGDWMRTGDEGAMDADGYLRFASRADDVITSAGYRIGPAEIEDCLTGHPAVTLAAVVGAPDPVRTEIVVAHVVLRAGVAGDAALAEALTAHVRERLGAHVAPRRVVFAERLPTTATGKIMRRELRGA